MKKQTKEQKCDVWLWKRDIKHSHVYLSLIIMQHGNNYASPGPGADTAQQETWGTGPSPAPPRLSFLVC